jgi:hypothetical protein
MRNLSGCRNIQQLSIFVEMAAHQPLCSTRNQFIGSLCAYFFLAVFRNWGCR